MVACSAAEKVGGNGKGVTGVVLPDTPVWASEGVAVIIASTLAVAQGMGVGVDSWVGLTGPHAQIVTIHIRPNMARTYFSFMRVLLSKIVPTQGDVLLRRKVPALQVRRSFPV
jgi:hypothetical protein